MTLNGVNATWPHLNSTISQQTGDLSSLTEGLSSSVIISKNGFPQDHLSLHFTSIKILLRDLHVLFANF